MRKEDRIQEEWKAEEKGQREGERKEKIDHS